MVEDDDGCAAMTPCKFIIRLAEKYNLPNNAYLNSRLHDGYQVQERVCEEDDYIEPIFVAGNK